MKNTKRNFVFYNTDVFVSELVRRLRHVKIKSVKNLGTVLYEHNFWLCHGV